jgi:hypothetical protein
VKIAIYDRRGAHVITLVNTIQGQGSYYVGWNGLSETRGEVAAGVYFARLQFKGQKRVAKLIVLR